jgi:hypothetical protein
MDTITLQWEVVPIVKSSLEMKRKALEFNLGRYKERLSAFERRYGMASEGFATKFNAGELGDDADWFEWQYLLDAYHETLRQLQLLGTIRL